MKNTPSYPAVVQMALANLILRILCLLIIEHECARLVQASSGTPAVMGNYLLATIYAAGFLLCLMNVRAGYLVAILAGTINILAKAVIIAGGHEHFPYYPVVWVTQCVIVIYFCLRAYTQMQTRPAHRAWDRT